MPQNLVLRIVLAGKVAHGLPDGLAVLDMERILAVAASNLAASRVMPAKGGHGRLLSLSFFAS